MTAASIYRWTPKGKFSRIYVSFRSPCEPRAAADKDAVWEQIKRGYYNIDGTIITHFWDSPEEEAEMRATWFESWDDIRCWDHFPDGVVTDDHF